DWEQRKLGDITKRVIRKNKDLDTTLPLTISAQEGLIDQNEFFNKTVASRDVSGYYLVRNGEFAYNKSYSKGYPWGAVKRLNRYNMGVLSTLYIVFKPTNIDSDFLEKYYDTTYWHKEVSKHAAEGARNHGLLNIAATDFFKTELVIPKRLEEQQRIASFFKQLDDTIALHQRKLDKLKQLKQGYLQQLFPKPGETVPKIRFANFEGEWEENKLATLFKKGGSGGTPKSTNPDYYGGNIPFLGISDISNSNGYIYSTEKTITSKGLENSSAWVVPKGAISLAMYASVGKLAILNIDAATSQAFYNMVFHDNKLRDFIYQRLLMANEIGEWSKLISTGTQSNLNADKVKNFNIKLSIDIKEIGKIGSIFKQLDNSITIHQNKLNQLKTCKKALLQKMFI
uniref:restriction endonuclease subunit S n=1 Tax=Lactococcus petauri TaxID=1940789 RepID=UPI00254E8DAD